MSETTEIDRSDELLRRGTWENCIVFIEGDHYEEASENTVYYDCVVDTVNGNSRACYLPTLNIEIELLDRFTMLGGHQVMNGYFAGREVVVSGKFPHFTVYNWKHNTARRN